MPIIISEITVDEKAGGVTSRQWEADEPLVPDPRWRPMPDPAAPLVLPAFTPAQLRQVK